jgi:GT2 family glycosyltransferase
MPALPRISIVTPSFQQASYIEATLRSVLGQRYPALEYFVFDGGSTDGSREIIERHAPELAGWRSEKDGGQASAINRGFAGASGEIFAWLNSDDLHWPHTLHIVGAHFAGRTSEPIVLTGGCVLFHEGSSAGALLPPAAHDPERLKRCDYFVQPSTFWTRAAWEKVGPLDESLHFTFDWDWFLRALDRCRFEQTPALLSAYRVHASHKSAAGGARRRDEIAALLEKRGSPTGRRLFALARSHPDLAPFFARYSHLRRSGFPGWAAALFSPRLLPARRFGPLDALADAWHSL